MYKNLEKIKIIFFITLFIIILFNFSRLMLLFDKSEEIITSSGIYAPLIYSLLMILVILISPIPSSPLVIIAGMIFNPWLALIYTLISATTGAVLAFLIARFLFNDLIKKKFMNNAFYKKIQKNSKRIVYFIFLTRLMPQVSFDLVSYLAGLTSIKLKDFILATFLGMIPIVIILIFFGQYLMIYKTAFFIFLFISFILYIIYVKMLDKNNTF